MNSEIGFRIGNRQLVAGLNLLFLKKKNGNSRVGGKVADRIGFR